MSQLELSSVFLEQIKQMYTVSGIPMAILDRDFSLYWCNEPALQAHPALKHPGGTEMLLAGYPPEVIRDEIVRLGQFLCKPIPNGLFQERGFIIFSAPKGCGGYYFMQPLQSDDPGGHNAPKGLTRSLASFESNYRTPLSSIFSSLSALKKSDLKNHGDSNSSTLKYYQQIGNNSLSLLRFGQMVTEYTRLSSGHYPLQETYVDMPDFCRELLGSAAEIIAVTEIPFFWQVSEAPFFAVCDTNCLTSIVGQLLSNSCRFTKPGNRIDVSVTFTNEEQNETQGGLGAFKTLRMRFSDRGTGIDPEISKLVFEPYFSRGIDGEPFVGNGLGLSIAQHAAALLGGSITFSSIAGEGTVFQVSIPLRHRVPGIRELRSSEMPHSPDDRFSPMRIYLADSVPFLF